TQNRKIEDRRGNSLRRVVQEFFGGKNTETPVLNFRDGEDQNDCKALRAAYLCLAVERDCKGSLGSQMLLAAKLAGHFTNETPTDKDLNNLVTTLGYSDYYTTKPVPFPEITNNINTMKTKQIIIRCTQESKIKIDRFCRELQLTQSQIIENLIENYQKPDTENKQIEELEGNYQELVKVVKLKELEIQELKDRIEELELMLDKQANNNQTSTDIETRFKQLEDLIKSQQSPVTNNQSTVTSSQLPVTSSQLPVKSQQSAARERNQQELELLRNAELWQSKKSGVVAEKIRRCFMALCVYNNEVATGDGDRIAITNIVLRELSGANGQVVGNWIEHHKDEILEHNNKFGMGNKKDHNNLYTVFNRGKNTDQYLEIVRKSLLSE
ncbi:MAG: hypothetical protein ACKPCP_18635, partial [Sphaerospermopsis kisseleviana]